MSLRLVEHGLVEDEVGFGEAGLDIPDLPLVGHLAVCGEFAPDRPRPNRTAR